MGFFTPDYMFTKTVNIGEDFLAEKGIKNLLLDVDNTLTTHDNPAPAEGITRWIEKMQAAGVNLIIVSNNSDERVKPFADLLGLSYTHDAAKPLPKGFNEAMKKLGASTENTAVVGDQIFTDVLGAHRRGLPILMVKPIELETKWTFKIKRPLEKPFVNHYLKKHGGYVK